MRKDHSLHDLLLIGAAIAAFGTSLTTGLFPWDDAEYLAHATTITGWRDWALGTQLGNYHPLTMLSLYLGNVIGNGAPWVQHAINLLLHIVSCLTIRRIALRLSSDARIALATALLFAVHPAQTESVAWIAERKNVQYAAFYFLAMLRYLGQREGASRRDHLWAIALFLCALLSKAQAVTLPLALLCVGIIRDRALPARRQLLALTPFFLLALFFGLLAVHAQQHDHYLHPERSGDLLRTIVLAGHAFMQYALHLLVPIRLAIFYPFPTSLSWYHIAGPVFLLLWMWGIRQRYRRGDHLLAGCMLFFLLDLLPLLQLVPVGEALLADRYAYVPSMPFFLGLVTLLSRSRIAHTKLTLPLFAGLLLALTAMSARRSSTWGNDAELFTDLVRYYPESDIAHYNLAVFHLQHDHPDTAAIHFAEAVRLDPTFIQAWYALGSIQRKQHQYDAAIHSLDQAIAAGPGHPNMFLCHYERALCEQEQGRPEAALTDIAQGLRTDPTYAPLHYLQGVCLAMLGRHQAAIRSYDDAERYGYDITTVRMNRAVSLGWLGEYPKAIHDLDQAIRTAPTPEAFFLRGVAKARSGGDGCPDLEKARSLRHPRANEAMAAYCG
ncbi:MAG: tetratricopeptide repeat protein [Flavobacteriales bacterium]